MAESTAAFLLQQAKTLAVLTARWEADASVIRDREQAADDEDDYFEPRPWPVHFMAALQQQGFAVAESPQGPPGCIGPMGMTGEPGALATSEIAR